MTDSQKGTSRARRIPVQERSRKRVDRMLEAAAEVFSEQGYEAATTEAIAKRAGTSIGSLYQFFPDKAALFEELAHRCVERSRDAFGVLFPSEVPAGTWPDLLSALVDGFVFLHRNDVAFRAVLVNFHLFGLFAEADTVLHREMVERVAGLLGGIAPSLQEKRRVVVARLLVTSVATLLLVIHREKDAQADDLIEEAKTMLRGYIAGYVTSPDEDSDAKAPRRARGRNRT